MHRDNQQQINPQMHKDSDYYDSEYDVRDSESGESYDERCTHTSASVGHRQNVE